ncbi:hypothetical protein GCM10023083_36250 [Streptomyces phyllanthi]
MKALGRTRLAKSVHDAGWSSFIGMLEYKAQRYGRTLVQIGRFTPTSQTCSTCGAVDGPKPLNVREWTCTACGTVHDRDINAAINIETAAGLAVSAGGHRLYLVTVTAPETARQARAQERVRHSYGEVRTPRPGVRTSRCATSARGRASRGGHREPVPRRAPRRLRP